MIYPVLAKFCELSVGNWFSFTDRDPTWEKISNTEYRLASDQNSKIQRVVDINVVVELRTKLKE